MSAPLTDTDKENARRERMVALANQIVPYISHPVGEGVISSTLVTTVGAAFGAAGGFLSSTPVGRATIIGIGAFNGLLAVAAIGEAIVDKIAARDGLTYIGHEGSLSDRLTKRWTVAACSAVIAGAAGLYIGLTDAPSTAAATTPPSLEAK